MAVDGLVSALIAWQGRDGGWGYNRGSTSCTEPTSLSLLALDRIPGARASVARGRDWLLRTQRADGGWAPHPKVDQSTWVTSLGVLSLPLSGSALSVGRGSAWLLEQAGQQATRMDRFRAWLLRREEGRSLTGWSWFPGTASWVIPTATGVLALEKAAGVSASSIQQRVAQGRKFLMARQCAGGGWNHGGTPIRSENSRAYPETTGIVLLAMNGHGGNRLRPALEFGERLLAAPESKEGESWLRLGLAAHGLTPERPSFSTAVPRTTVGLALELIAALPHNPFLPGTAS